MSKEAEIRVCKTRSARRYCRLVTSISIVRHVEISMLKRQRMS